METQFAGRQTMSEFFTPGKSHRVWKIILALLLTVMIIGAAYVFTRPQEDPVPMAYDVSGSTYVYLDLQLLSDWIYSVSGDSNYTFYMAMDADGNWFLITLDQSDADSLSAYYAAYCAYMTDDYLSYDYPDPVRLTGTTRRISSDDVGQLSSSFDVTNSELTGYFGCYYLNEGVNDHYDGAYGFLFGAFIFGLFLLIVALQGGGIRKNYKKSDQRLYELGQLDEAEAAFSSPESLRFDKAKLVLSEGFAFCGASGYALPYEDIGWLYKRNQRSYGVTVATQLIAGLKNGKTIFLANRGVTDELVSQAARAVLNKNPNCLIGYTRENIKSYRQRVKEYKLNHPK